MVQKFLCLCISNICVSFENQNFLNLFHFLLIKTNMEVFGQLKSLLRYPSFLQIVASDNLKHVSFKTEYFSIFLLSSLFLTAFLQTPQDSFSMPVSWCLLIFAGQSAILRLVPCLFGIRTLIQQTPDRVLSLFRATVFFLDVVAIQFYSSVTGLNNDQISASYSEDSVNIDHKVYLRTSDFILCLLTAMVNRLHEFNNLDIAGMFDITFPTLETFTTGQHSGFLATTLDSAVRCLANEKVVIFLFFFRISNCPFVSVAISYLQFHIHCQHFISTILFRSSTKFQTQHYLSLFAVRITCRKNPCESVCCEVYWVCYYFYTSRVVVFSRSFVLFSDGMNFYQHCWSFLIFFFAVFPHPNSSLYYLSGTSPSIGCPVKM